MSDIKPDVDELVSKDDFDSLLELLFGKDVQLAKKAARGIAKIIVEPHFIGSMGEKGDESRRRLGILLSKESERVLDVMFALLGTQYVWQVKNAVEYIVRHGKAIDLFQRLDQEEYQTTRGYTFKVLLFIDWIVGSGNLQILFQNFDQGKYNALERAAVFKSLLALTVLDRIRGTEYRAPSGVTGNIHVISEVLRRANNDDDVTDFTSTYPDYDTIGNMTNLREALADFLANKCSEKDLLEVLQQCKSFHAICVICKGLERIGTEESLSILGHIPLDIPDHSFGSNLTTENPIYLVISAICERLETPDLQRLSKDKSGIVKEIVERTLDWRCKHS